MGNLGLTFVTPNVKMGYLGKSVKNAWRGLDLESERKQKILIDRQKP
jgi:hypothetical protein